MASLDTCEPSIDASRNGTSAETATAPSAAAAEEAAPCDADNATVTPDTSDENDDNPLIDDASDPDVDACLRVLDRITKDPAAFGTPQHRRLRGAVRAAHGALTAGDFGGMDGLVHGRRRQLRKEREARATRRRDLDQKHRDSTQLRKQRIDRLRALENDQGPLLLAPDGAAKEGESTLEAAATDSFRHCYTCKKRFDGLHEFYSQLCPACAALNWRMRSRTEDLTGRVALLTGARVKIGFETGLKLLRAGAYLIATTRFPHDLAARYNREADADEWRGRLEVHGLDLRDLRGVETFCAFIAERHEALDVLVNNACQTVRRFVFRRPFASLRRLLDGVAVSRRWRAGESYTTATLSTRSVPAGRRATTQRSSRASGA